MNTLNFKEFIEFVKENILEPDKLTIGVNWAKNHLSQATNDSKPIDELLNENESKIKDMLYDMLNKNMAKTGCGDWVYDEDELIDEFLKGLRDL